MNGVHDMGGMHGFGPITIEKNEPVFHAQWEARVYAMTRALRGGGKWNLDSGRHEIEQLPPAEYLRMTYYEKWFARLRKRVVTAGLVTIDELESGRPDAEPRGQPALTAAMVHELNARGASARRNVPVAPRFKIGDRVRARNINPTGHTRLPRYARGKSGHILLDHGVFVFPDTNAHFLGENPQHVYSVRFAAEALWGDQASARDFVHLDLWDDYLELA